MRSSVSALVLFITVLVLAGGSDASELSTRFKRALESKDYRTMTVLVKKNIGKIPSEVASLMDEAFAPGLKPAERDSLFTVAEFMADEYRKQTGDTGLVKGVKVRVFESKLAGPVTPAPQNGVYIVEAVSTEGVKNTFVSDNIVIKKGSTVRWVNNDTVAHLLASVPVIGSGGIFSPTLETGASWEHTFVNTGEYYYICFIHRVMYGKVTVVD